MRSISQLKPQVHTHARRTLGIAAVVVTASVTFLECNPEFAAPYAPVVRDTVDYFEYTAPVDGVTTTSRYSWETTGTVAKVNLMSTVTRRCGDRDHRR